MKNKDLLKSMILPIGRAMKKARALLLLCTLLLMNAHAYAGQTDFIGKDADDVYIKYVKNGGDATQQNIAGDGQSDIALGTVSSLVITEFRAVAKNKDSKTCAIWMAYGINTSRNGTINSSVSAGHNTSGYADWTWDSYWGCQQFKNSSVNLDLLNEKDPGNYWYDFYFTLEGNTDNSDKCYSDVAKWWNNGGKYHMSYTIPSRNLTVSRANSNGSVTGSETGVKKGHAYTITATPNTHYAFTGWTTSDSHITIADANSATTTVTFDDLSANATVTANFEYQWAIQGSGTEMGAWSTYNSLPYSGTANTYTGTISLAANTTYVFKIRDRRTGNYWGYGDSDYQFAYVGQTTAYDHNLENDGSKQNLVIMTAKAGTYTFTWNSSTKRLTVGFPEQTHPNNNYIYFKNSGGSAYSSVNAHIWGGGTGSTGFGRLPSLPSFTFDGGTYYYAAIGNNSSCLFADGEEKPSTKTSDQSSLSLKRGQFYDLSSSTWKDFTATLTLNHQSATNTPAPNSITVTYGASTNLTGDVITTTPAKTGYNFGGYYTQQGGGGLQLIGSNENVVASVSGYTDSNKKWIKTGATVSTTIYAKWTQTVELDANGGASDGSVTATFNGGLSGFSAVGARTGYTCLGYYTAALGGEKVINTGGTAVSGVDGWTDGSGNWIHAGASTLYAHWQPNAASGRTLFKFEVSSSIADGNVCAATGTNYSQTVAGGQLSTLEGGTLTASATSSNTNLKFTSNAYNFNGGNGGQLYIKLDAPIQTGDVVRFVNSAASGNKVNFCHTSKDYATDKQQLDGCGNSIVQVIELPSGFNGEDEIYLSRGAGTTALKSLEILRPYVVTLNATKNGGTVNGEDTEDMYFAAEEPQALPHATQDEYRFTGWFTTFDGNSEAANPYTATASTTLYAQFETCASVVSGTVYKFKVNTGLTDGNSGITGTFDINKGNYLSSLVGGTLTGYDKDGTKMGIQGNNAFKINEKSNAYLQIDLDCAIQAGDTIITTIKNSGTTFYITKSSGSTTSAQDLSVGDNQKVVVPEGLVDESTLYLKVKDNNKTTCISSFEIKRPTKYTVSYNNGGGSGTMTSHSVADGADQALTANTFTKNGYTFSCWHANVAVKVGGSTISAGGDISDGATLQDVSSDITLTAQWTCTTPSFSTDLSTTQVDYAKDASATALTVEAGANSGTVTYQWYSNDGNDYTSPTALENCTTATYTPLTTSAGTMYYYCVATNTTGSCSVSTNSSIAKIVVTDCTDVGISGQPSSVAKANVGSASSLSVTASGTSPTYQWYSCDDADKTNASAITSGTNPSGYTSATLSFTPSTAGTTYYYCVVSGSCGDPVTSNVVSITAKNAISPTLTYDATVAVGSTINPSLSGNTGSGTVTYALNDVTPTGSLTINASTGAVTGVTAGGTATVTATIDATASYWGNTATSGTITVPYNITHSDATNGSYTIKVGDASAVSTSTTAVSGQTVALAATPSSGYVLNAWNVTGATVGNNNIASTSFTMSTSNVTVAPTFKTMPNVYYYKDGTRYANSTYKAPDGSTATSGNDNTINSGNEWTVSNSITGLTVSAKGCKYDGKTGSEIHITSYLKVPKDGGASDQYVKFVIASGYKATNLKIKIGGYSKNPTVTLKPYTSSLGDAIAYTGTVGGVATKENNFNEISWSNLASGTYYLNVSSQNAYISEIDAQMTTTCTDPGLAYDDDEVTVTLCDGTYTNTLTNPNSVSVSYTSDDETVATVASDGTVTIKKAGTATITASFAGDATYCEDDASYELTVNSSTAAGLSYSVTSMEKDNGASSFTNSLTNSNGLTVTYSSDEESVATVNESTGAVTIVGPGTTTITASSAQQKVSSTCYAAGEASYTLKVYPVYTVEYNAMGGTCGTSSANTVLGKVTLPSATYGTRTLVWVKTDGTEVGGAGDDYEPTGNITLYAKWKGSCSASGSTTLFAWTKGTGADISVDETSLNGNNMGSMTTGTSIVARKLGSNDIDNKTGGYALGNNDVAIEIQGTLNFAAGDVITITGRSNSNKETRKFSIAPSSVSHAQSTDTVCTNAILNDSEDLDYTATLTATQAGTKIRIFRYDGKTVWVKGITVTRSGVGTCYSVTYDGNGATAGYVNDTMQYTSGATVYAKINDYRRDGYEFNGWNTKADGSGTKLSSFTITKDTTLYAQWKIIIDADNTNFADKDTPSQYKDVVVTKGATLTLTQNTTVRNITIETGSTLNVATNSGSAITLTTDSIALVGGWGRVGNATKYDMPRVYIDPKSKITHTKTTIPFDIAVDNRNFYPIALPFPVTVSDVDYKDATLAYYSIYGTAGQYVIKTYDGQFRANYGSVTGSWRVMRDGYWEYKTSSGEASEILQPGHGYILRAVTAKYAGYSDEYAVIRFPMKNVDNEWTNGGEKGHYTDGESVTHIKDTVHVIAYKKAEGETAKANTGWNLLGVPYMSCYTTGAGMYDDDNVTSPATLLTGRFKYDTNTWEDGTIMYVTVPTHNFSEYIQANIADDDTLTTLLPGWCFFVQVAETGNLTFLADSAAASSDLPIYAPKREKAMPTVKTGIILSGDAASDKTTLLVSDRYSAAEYEINADLEKMFGENSYTLATYSLSGETRLAYNAMSKADAANIVPIGYRAPADGEYAFSINPHYAENGAFESVNLIDYETGDITDLLLYNYSFSTERTQNDERFALFVVPRQNTPTGLENGADGTNDANGVRKMIINDKLYIIVDGKMYDAVGKMVK